MPLNIGVFVKIIINKSNDTLKKHGIEEIARELKKQLDLSLYDMQEDENHLIWMIKDEVLEKQLSPFIERQYQYFNDQDKNQEIIEAIKKTGSASEIIALANEKRFPNFQILTSINGIAVGSRWDYLRYKYETIIYCLAGKAIMEEYNDTFRYLERMIRLQCNEFPIAGAVQIAV